MAARREKDTLGEIEVPADALWGAQTQRAIENYPISGYKSFPAFVRAMVRVKRAGALANGEEGRLDPKRKDAIVAACDEILAGRHLDQFVVDVFHSGAGVSFHMNVNEVVANRANQICGGGLGTYEHVSPNDHVNMSQSTNDVTPTAMRLAHLELTQTLCEELDKLPDALPAKDLFASMQSMAPFVRISSGMRTAAIELSQICNDIRILVSGPRTGFGELVIPAMQPGSSIMPGKVNPAIAEMVNQVCFQVIGNDTTVAWGAQAGQLELNVMMPGINYAVCFSATILTNAVRQLRTKCVDGMRVDEHRAKELIDASPSLLVTALSPHITYARAAALAKRALGERRSLLDVALEEKVMPEADLRRILDPLPMTKGGVQE